jgi:hypothetical protein
MSPAHTTGPWTIDTRRDGTVILIDGPGHFGTVARLEAQDDNEAGLRNNADNALLIAAVPAMVNALQIVDRCWPDSHGGVTLGSYEMGVVRAALAKAGV